MNYLKIQHLSNNPKNTAAVTSTQKNTDFRNSKPKKILRWSWSVNMPSPPPGCSVHWAMFSRSGDTMSTSGEYLEHIGDVMIHVGEEVDKRFWFILKTPMYWTFLDVVMISPEVLMVSRDVLNTHYTGCFWDKPWLKLVKSQFWDKGATINAHITNPPLQNKK